MSPAALTVAVAIPCADEETTILTVVARFTAALPDAEILVFDNASAAAFAAFAIAQKIANTRRWRQRRKALLSR